MLNILLSTIQLNKFIKQKAVLAFIILLLLTLISCGKRKPPLPPVEKVQQRVEISGFQRGDKIFLSWIMPNRNATDSDLLNIDRADLYRLVEPLNADYTLSEDEFAARSIVIANVKINPDDFLNTKSYIDQLEFAGQPVRLRYAIRFVNKNGQKAAFSNFLLIEPIASIPTAPSNLKAVVTQDYINLNWEKPVENINQTKNVSILGYNVYRSQSEKETAKLITRNPISDTEFLDVLFEFGKTYFYFTRAVTLGSNGKPVESEESNIVKISPLDNFAPAPPEAITIAASPGMISIFFAVNTEKDIAGYKIYRTNDEALPKENWQLLTPDLLTANTFQDTKIESGNRYFYYLQAVDNAGNISAPSVVIFEIAP